VTQFNSPSAIPRTYAQMIVDASVQRGLDANALLEHAGISQELWRGGGDISAVHFGRLYQRMLWLMRDESFGMLTGESVPLGSFRMMCLSVVHCRVLGDVIDRIGEFCDIAIGYQTKPVSIERGDETFIRVEPTSTATNRGSLNSREQLGRTRSLVLMWYNFCSWLVGRSLPITAVHFCNSDAQTGELLSFPKSLIKSNMSEDGLVLPSNVMRWPVVQTESSLEEFLANAVYHLICAQPNMGTYSARVSDLIAQAPSLNRLRASDVASSLACSEATLRRRLSAEETNFQALKDQYRQSAALRNLSTSRMALKEKALRHVPTTTVIH